MSTASPLPLQPLPSSTLSEAEARALKQQVSSRLMEHRQRRPRHEMQSALPLEGLPTPPRNRVADQVAARFAKSQSYREFLQGEAAAAVRKAEAAAEVARRSADAIAAVQGELLAELQQWDGEVSTGPVDVVSHTAQAGQHHAAMAAGASVHAPAVVEDARTAQAAVWDLPIDTEPAVPLPANLIEFPRQLVAARRARPRLAEGPFARRGGCSAGARTAPHLRSGGQLRLHRTCGRERGAGVAQPAARRTAGTARPAEHADAQISFAVPVQTAPVSQRFMAAAVDGCCITAAWLGAIAVVAGVSPDLPTGVPALASAAGLLALFAVLYKMLFFSLADATPGMRYARIGLCTFADENPTRGSMRRRMLAVLLAGLPLGLGLAWVLLDEDGLGWHDRISRMYPAPIRTHRHIVSAWFSEGHGFSRAIQPHPKCSGFSH